MKLISVALCAVVALAVSSLALWPSPASARWDHRLMAAGLSQTSAALIDERYVDGYTIYRAAVGGGQQATVAALLSCGPSPSPEQMESLIDLAKALGQRGILRLLRWHKDRREEADKQN